MKELKDIINDYTNDTITLKIFEDDILALMKIEEDELLDDILEDIAYTSTGKSNQNLMSEKELKKKLKEYLK